MDTIDKYKYKTVFLLVVAIVNVIIMLSWFHHVTVRTYIENGYTQATVPGQATPIWVRGSK